MIKIVRKKTPSPSGILLLIIGISVFFFLISAYLLVYYVSELQTPIRFEEEVKLAQEVSEFQGVDQFGFSAPPNTDNIPGMKDIGARWVRFDMSWSGIEGASS